MSEETEDVVEGVPVPAPSRATAHKAYATWLLQSNYIPLPKPVGDVDGVSTAACWRYEHSGLPEGDARRAVVAAAAAELATAKKVSSGKARPKGWPGERAMSIFRARTSSEG